MSDSNGRVAGKVALVTGAAGGLGLATATMLAAQGATVYLSDLADDKGSAAAKDIGAAYLHQDVTSEERWQEVMQEIGKAHGKLDILVNNAGIGGSSLQGNPENAELQEWQRVQEINLQSVFLACKQAIPVMREQGGSIVNLSSVAALMVTPFVTPYSVSKAGVAHLSRNVAMYCATQGYRIRCNSVHPGQIDTDMHRSGLRDFAESMRVEEEEVRQGFLQKIPLGEMGQPDDIAYAVLYLASDESRHVTGTQLVVDGGMTLNG